MVLTASLVDFSSIRSNWNPSPSFWIPKLPVVQSTSIPQLFQILVPISCTWTLLFWSTWLGYSSRVLRATLVLNVPTETAPDIPNTSTIIVWSSIIPAAITPIPLSTVTSATLTWLLKTWALCLGSRLAQNQSTQTKSACSQTLSTKLPNWFPWRGIFHAISIELRSLTCTILFWLCQMNSKTINSSLVSEAKFLSFNSSR